MMSGNSVMVTGDSLVTAAGGTTRESWSSLRAGRTGIVRNSLFDTSELLSDWAGQVTTERTGRIDRCYSLAERGVAQALAQAGLTPSDLPGPRTALVVGSSLGAMESLQAAHREAVLNDTVDAVTALDSQIHSVADFIATRFGVTGPRAVTSNACAAGAIAIGYAAELLWSGEVDRVVCGGVDPLASLSSYGFSCLGALDAEPCSPMSASTGLTLGEGAGFLVLERRETAERRGAEILAEIGGYGTSCDGYHQPAPDPRGEGAFQSMADALACAGCEPADVSYVNLHGTGTPTNDAVEPKAISRLFGETAPVTSSTKSALGHTLGAAGAVEAVCAVLAIRTGTIPPTINTRGITSPSGLDIVPDQARSGPVDVVLSNSFAFGGNNASLVVTGPRGKPSPASGAHRSDVMITGIAGVCGKAATTEELIAAFADGGEFEELENLPGGIGGAVPFARSDLTRLRRGVNPARARRMDPLSLLANAALTDMYSRYGRPTRAESAGTGIVFATGYGPLSALLSFHEGVVKEGMRGADPLVFPNTVVNAATGHLAMLHRLRGYTATLAGAGVSSIMALTLARHVIARGGAERIVVVVADEFPDLAISSAVLRGGFRRVGEQCGAVLADGAVAIMLESRRSARERDAAPLARIMSSAATGTAEEPCGEDSAERSWADCLSTALQRAGADSEDIATFVSARCGDPAHDALEKKAARRVGLSGTRTLAPQMLIGNSAGSAAGLGLLNALVDEERRKDDLIMLSSRSDGGAFASMVVECA